MSVAVAVAVGSVGVGGVVVVVALAVGAVAAAPVLLLPPCNCTLLLRDVYGHLRCQGSSPRSSSWAFASRSHQSGLHRGRGNTAQDLRLSAGFSFSRTLKDALRLLSSWYAGLRGTSLV